MDEPATYVFVCYPDDGSPTFGRNATIEWGLGDRATLKASIPHRYFSERGRMELKLGSRILRDQHWLRQHEDSGGNVHISMAIDMKQQDDVYAYNTITF